MTDTQQSLAKTATKLQGVFSLQNSLLANGLNNDCDVFDQKNICISVGKIRNSNHNQELSKNIGLLIAAYRSDDKKYHYGFWFDQNSNIQSIDPFRTDYGNPLIGIFGVWKENPDSTGAEFKFSAAHGKSALSIVRENAGLSESGSGSSQLINQGFQLIGKYGIAVNPNLTASPYLGVRHISSHMNAYAENNVISVPLNFNAIDTSNSKFITGAELKYRGIEDRKSVV